MAGPHPELFAEAPVERNVSPAQRAAKACMAEEVGAMSPAVIRALDRYAVDNLGFVPEEVLTALERYAAERVGAEMPDAPDPEPEAALY